MPKPGLDFQPRYPGLLSIALLIAGSVLCADAWHDWQSKRQQLAELHGQLAQLERRNAPLNGSGGPAGERQAALPAEQGKALQQALASIQTDWEALYRHIDQATGEDLALLTIIPNAAAHTVQLSGEARSLRDALVFIDALRQPPLAQVSLLSHKVKTDDPQRPVSFEITATWMNSQ